MTPTAKELWSSPKFLTKRFWEQVRELGKLNTRTHLSGDRYKELHDSIIFIIGRILRRRSELIDNTRS